MACNLPNDGVKPAIEITHGEDRFQDLEVYDGTIASPRRAYLGSSSSYIPNQGFERYRGAMKNLIPLRKNSKEKEIIGVDSAGFFSFVSYSWISKYMYQAHRNGLMFADLPQGSPQDTCDYNSERLAALWQNEIKIHGPTGASLGRVVWKFIRTRVLFDWLAYILSVVLGFLTPVVFLRKLLEYAQDSDAAVMTGVMWALCLVLGEVVRLTLFSWHWALAFRTAVRLRSACMALLYRKIIRMNNFNERSVGELVNIFGNDAQRIFDMVLFGPAMVGGPVVMICGILYIYWLLDFWALFGVLVFIFFYPILYCITHFCGHLRGKIIGVSDQRLSLMTEILQSMKQIKLYTWEEYFTKNINAIRGRELSLLKKVGFLTSFSTSMAPTIPIFSAIATFLAHLKSGGSLTASQAFSLMAIINTQFRNSINVTQIGYQNTVEARIGFKRMQRILLIEEGSVSIQRPIDNSQAVSVGGATFTWEIHLMSPVEKNKSKQKKKSETPGSHSETKILNPDTEETRHVLHDINFSAAKGHLIGVCGTVGSGKSSLLHCILGQMRLVSGQLARCGTCAFVAQKSWIPNGTLKENILFGEPFNERRYYQVLYSCALSPDLDQLPARDETEIGERGVNLSGGQKQRLCLARALYANKDIYLLDDPLSAVDANIGSFVFENCILKELGSKTVVLVTHNINYLKQCSEIFVMRDGTIIERGTHDQLLAERGEYSTVCAAPLQDEIEANMPNDCSQPNIDNLSNNSVTPKNVSEVKSEKSNNSANAGKLTVPEISGQGGLKTSTYLAYISEAGGFIVSFLVVGIFLLNVGSAAFSSWWLALWINAGGGNATVLINNQTFLSSNLADNPDFSFYQTVYASMTGVILITSVIRCFVFTETTLRASMRLHSKLFKKIMFAPMVFFESNPLGRLQNLFSRDVDEVDSRLPCTVENILQNICIVAFAFLFICTVFPWFFFPLLILAFIYHIISSIFRKAIRELKRIESTTRSPIFSCIEDSVQGLSTIHAFNKERDFINKFFTLYDNNSTSNYMTNVAMRWLAVRIDSLAVVTICITSALVIVLHNVVSPAMAGLALAYAWQISGVFQYTIRLMSETEVRFISVERIQSYIESIKTEGREKTVIVSPSWPTHGRIHFQNVNLQYREGLSYALQNVSFTVGDEEHIGIAGRTGSGKSSLISALLRLVELSSGRITIDGIDISEVPLPTLRSKLCIIPQDPVTFSVSIRKNLDPTDHCSDEQIWSALEKTQLADKVKDMPLQLKTVVGAGNETLSVGERQLLCLARALLRNSKILILDEATASIDLETEAKLQSTLKKEFKRCTVLTIAHRLSSIANCDRVLVLDQGKVVEFDEPEKLQQNSNSFYSRMLAAANAPNELCSESK